MKNYNRVLKSVIFILAFIAVFIASVSSETERKTIDAAYPGLVSGALTQARIADMPDGILLKSKDVEITRNEIDQEMDKMPPEMKKQMEKNRLFLLEQMATGPLLLILAKGDSGTTHTEGAEEELIQSYFEKLTSGVSVTEKELREFYNENKDMIGGAPFEDIANNLKSFLLEQKKQEAALSQIKNIGKTLPISVSSAWLKEQVKLALENPVDKARMSGKPSMVDFGASGCRPCDMMAPILENLKEKYKDKINVVFIHVNQERILGARFGIQSIPVQVFFDKTGRELFRHTGYYSKEDIENKFSELGMK